MCGNCEVVPAQSDAARLEASLRDLKAGFMDVTHTFLNGVYTRSGRVQAGEILVGTRHRKKNFLHVSRGRIAIWDNYNGFRIVSAPHTEISAPGIQRIGIALEYVEMCNILETDAVTVLDVENEMIFPLTLPENIGEKILNLVREAGLQLIWKPQANES
jgi:hypothetical protein